jgi:hypothetical protein
MLKRPRTAPSSSGAMETLETSSIGSTISGCFFVRICQFSCSIIEGMGKARTSGPAKKDCIRMRSVHTIIWSVCGCLNLIGSSFSGVHWLLGAQFRLIDRLPALSLPKLIIHGDRDDIIPFELGRQIYEAAKPPKMFHVINGAAHNNTYQVGGARYFQTFSDFAGRAIRS